MIVLDLAWRSIWSRRGLAVVSVLSIALSVMLLLGVQKIRDGVRTGFSGTVSNVDLIVGSRSGGLQLMLASVFRIGELANNFTWDTYEEIAARPEVAWIIPISLGDSHRGFRVVGTNQQYFDHLRYRGGRALEFAAGASMTSTFEAVLGSSVASHFGYGIGSTILINHGLGTEALAEHVENPFVVVGILAPTGTPVDRSVHIGLDGIEALHELEGEDHGHEGEEAPAGEAFRPDSITAAFVGLRTPIDTFVFQRFVSQYEAEPLTAVLPGLALLELWSLLEVAEKALLAVSAMVVVVALIGMATTIFSMVNQRRREMAILRSVGASPVHVSLLLLCESMLLAISGILVGTGSTLVGIHVLRPWIGRAYGVHLPPPGLAGTDLLLLGLVLVAALVAGLAPAWKAYRQSVIDRITPLD